MARWWCVASADPVSLQRVVAASLIGLLALSAFDPLLTERSAQGQFGWLAGMLVAVLGLVADRRRPVAGQAGAAAPEVLGIDSAAALYRGPADAVALEAVDTAGLGAWRVGPWQFIRLRAGQERPRLLAFDRRRIDPPAWAALQRALVRARRRP